MVPAGTGTWWPLDQWPREGAAGLPEAFRATGVGCGLECPRDLGATGGEGNLGVWGGSRDPVSPGLA